jgi:hypothetical protein
MSEPKSEFLRQFISRGYMHQCTDLAALDGVAQKGLTAYIGFDESGRQADRAHGRRHHQGRRSHRQR